MMLRRAIMTAVLATITSAVPVVIRADSRQPRVVGRLAYVRRTVAEQPSSNGRTSDVVYMKLPSLESVKLTVTHPLLDSNIEGFQWSPHASRLLFVAKAKGQSAGDKQRSGGWVPWILDLRTKELHSVTQPTADRKYLRADWFPDGRRIIAWVLTGKNPDVTWWAGVGPVVNKGGDSRLIVIDLRSNREKTVWRSKHGYSYACSPARDEFLIWSGDYYLVSADRGLKWRIKGSETPDGMSFSPDGRKIAVCVGDKLQIIDRITRARRVVYMKAGGARSLVWSPHSKWIAFRESRNEAASYDPPVVDFGWAVTAVNVDTKEVHEFPLDVYKQGEFSYTPDVLGWTKDSQNLVLSVPEDTGKPYPEQIRDKVVLCPLTGGRGVSVADITSGIGGLAWLPK